MNKLFKHASKALICLLALPFATVSCFDDTAIWETLNEHEAQLNEIQTQLANQADALTSLLSGGSTISSCVEQKDGSYLVTLSTGTKFKVLPQQTNVSALMSYVVIDGNKYWALYNHAGELEPITDLQGKNIPVSVQVDVEVKDSKYYIVINGYEYETGYDAGDAVQVFQSCVPHTDATGNVYAMTFTFGEGLEVTVSVDGYKGVIFKLDNLGVTQVVTEYYVPYASTQSFLVDMEGVVDYVMQIPHGWKVVERVDEQSGNTYMDVTAPAKSALAAGAAFDRGDLKVVAVVEGGDAAITKLVLSAEPFKKVEFSSTRLVAEPYEGVQKYVYGIVPSDDYNQDEVIATAQTLVSTSADAPSGYAVGEGNVAATLADMLGGELDSNKKYVLFVVPAIYQESEDEAGFYIDADSFQSYRVGAVIVTMSDPVASLFDAQVNVEVKGTDKIWAGTAVKSDDLFTNIVYSIVNGIWEPYTEGLTYNGAASKYPVDEANLDVDFAPGTTYVTWCVPYDSDKATYTEADIVYKEFTTNPIQAGGSLTVVTGESVITTSSISVPLSSEGAEMIYYAYLTESEGKRLGSTSGLDDQKFNLILKSDNCTLVKGNEAVASIEQLIPESAMWLYAAAVDANGKYGTVKCLSTNLAKVEFNTALTVSYVEDGCSPGSDEMDYQVTVTGGTAARYIYWIGTPMDPLWVKCGKDKNALAKYMAVYPEDEAITKVMRANGDFSADGKITITGLRMEEEYIMMVLAQDENGAFSKGAYKKMTTLAADLGAVRAEGTELWNAAKESIQIDWLQEYFEAAANQAMMARYAFNFSCPQDYTAFILCASDSYFSEAGFTKTTQIMIEIENYCSRKYDDGHTPIINGDYASEPDYYKNGELRGGQMMNVVDFYVHGLPTMGFATYFAPGSHGDGNCIYWENGHDVNYQRALDLIEEYKTLAKYEEKAEAFGLKGQEAADWAKALLEAYLPYYEEAEPLIYFNNGDPLYMMNPYAMGVDDKGELHDRVVVMLKDRDGNYFEPMYFEVPNYFEK